MFSLVQHIELEDEGEKGRKGDVLTERQQSNSSIRFAKPLHGRIT